MATSLVGGPGTLKQSSGSPGRGEERGEAAWHRSPGPTCIWGPDGPFGVRCRHQRVWSQEQGEGAREPDPSSRNQLEMPEGPSDSLSKEPGFSWPFPWLYGLLTSVLMSRPQPLPFLVEGAPLGILTPYSLEAAWGLGPRPYVPGLVTEGGKRTGI